MARSITDLSQQVQALTAVAQALAVVGDHGRAGQLLGAVLAVASWRVPLSVLVGHWPQVGPQPAEIAAPEQQDRPAAATDSAAPPPGPATVAPAGGWSARR